MYRNIYYSFPEELKLLQQKLGIEAIPVMEKLVIVSTYGIPRVMFFIHNINLDLDVNKTALLLVEISNFCISITFFALV